ncbi:cell envelope integrity TolA C-terminal domain-containing protein [Shewanella sp. ENK2]|uniref:cell envelope integrity TolA C-terminal domain-containing protein n=1 Tax=Shewanella sp. ENK2 TaxID=2775245 RepID=UPI00374A70AA
MDLSFSLIKDLKLMTLAFYKVLFVSLMMLAPISSSIASNSSWLYQQKLDPMTDQSINTTSVSSTSRKGLLTVRCTNNEALEIFFSLGRYQFLGDQIFKTKYRVDKHKAVTIESRASTKGTSAFIVDYYISKMLPSLKSGENLLIEFKDYNNTPRLIQFPLKDSLSALTRLESNCAKGLTNAESALARHTAIVSKPAPTIVTEQAKIYERMIRSTIQRFMPRGTQNQNCKISLSINYKGVVTKTNIISGDGDVCLYAKEAIKKAKKLPMPNNPDVHELLKNIELTITNKY